MFFVCAVISDMYLFQEIVVLNPCFIFSRNLILLIEKVTTGTWNLALFIWNVVPVVCIASTSKSGRLAFGLPATLGAIDISDIIHSFDHDQSSSVSQLINGKSKNL